MRLLIIVGMVCGLGFAAQAEKADAEDIKVVCPKDPPKPPKWPRNKTYEGMPFQPGEKMVYETSWSNIKAGYGTLSVAKPKKHGGYWHRSFKVEASTGELFEAIYVAKYKIESISRPWDFGISKFYMEEDSGKLFSKPTQKQKWLDFDHITCKVEEKELEKGGKPETESYEFAPGGVDVLGSLYFLRTLDLKVGSKHRVPVYSSEKNWWLEFDPQKIETITVPAGKFKAVKAKVQTFIGKEMQQKGDVFAWVAIDHPNRPLIQIEGDIKIGSVFLKLHKYTPGK
jgi:hypothetical protein